MCESSVYVVKAGDYLEKIARENGFLKWQQLYYHPCNQRFRLKRPNPNRIFVDDVVMIPAQPGKPVAMPILLLLFILFQKGPKPAPPAEPPKQSWVQPYEKYTPPPENPMAPPPATGANPLWEILKNMPAAPDSKNEIEQWWEKVKPYVAPEIGDYKVKLDPDTMWQLLLYWKERAKM